MNIITVASRKGGTGKSTLIAHLCAFVHQSGRRCFAIDTDAQGSLTLWHMLRPGKSFRLQSPGRSIEPLLVHAQKDGVEWVFIDTPPTMDAAVGEAIGAATLVVIPSRPSLFDLAAVRETVAASRVCRKPYAVVLNAAPPKREDRVSPLVKQAREHLDSLAIPVWSGQISYRLGYAMTLATGAGIAEAQPELGRRRRDRPPVVGDRALGRGDQRRARGRHHALCRLSGARSAPHGESIFRRKPAPDLIRGGRRFGAENATNLLESRAHPRSVRRKMIQSDRDAL